MKNIEYWLLDNKLVKASLFLGCVIRALNDYNLTLGMHATSRLIDWLIEWMNAGGGGVVYNCNNCINIFNVKVWPSF